ncbi:DNA-binding transcriptional regulator, GntR family [Paracoccus halophilus]|uniref:DNA-binding transcriptional regulator, GntR family n=1 Tax=Paracoccus halophilus TaxID=376733 RepID=A0A099EXP4_9RHOB|nr:GntR family transcriptional regulator [Paracoccus halophilus]KGJ03205.1 GntR family transcriptional regulator [Paracoccus halophilus]SFA52956.1 DNA-binding transcriptional regulator, GntR family [Paracoccus halophilus]
MDSPVITPPPSTASQVHDWLRRRVQRGDLAPGARLSETEIANEIGTSRQPVREAFIRLAGDGLAEVRPQRGTYISKISVSAVLSARLIREAVESDLARMIATQRPARVLAAMREEIDHQRRADDRAEVEAFIESDDRFHRLLAAGAGHEAVWNDLERLKAQMNRLRHLSMRAFDRAHTIRQHVDILDALEAGDADAAERALRTHLRQMLTELPRIAVQKPEYFTE